MGAADLELCQTFDGIVLNVGLDNTKVRFAALDGVDVTDRTAGLFYRATDAVSGDILVHQATDSVTRKVIDAGRTAGADHYGILLRDGERAAKRCSKHQSSCSNG